MTGTLRAGALLLAASVLAACSSMPRQAETTATLVMPPVLEAAPEPAALPTASAADDFWQHLRNRFVFADCDAREVRHWADRYTRNPGIFTRHLRASLPPLRYVSEALEHEELPGEFAFLPWVESNFRPLPGKGAGAAGIWQIMHATGRELGLEIGPRYDARLDLEKSTRGAIRLLAQNHDRLGDWRLATMAYNAGLGRVRRVLPGEPANEVLEPARLPLHQTTLDHLAKVQALACIVQEPTTWDVELPAAGEAPKLVYRAVPEGIHLPVAAGLAGLDFAELSALNPGILDSSRPASGLVLPATALDRFDAGLARLDAWGWSRWHWLRLEQAVDLPALAPPEAERVAVLAAINDPPPDGRLARGRHLWLPSGVLADLAPEVTAALSEVQPGRYVVRSGDSLWAIARRFRLSVADLRLWNRIEGSLLRTGQVLLLQPRG